jgi:rubredoxin
MKKLNQTQFIARVKEVYDDEYTVVGQYTLAKLPVEIRHTTCGKTWSPAPNVFLNRNSGCPHCNVERSRKQFSKTHDQFVEEVREASDEYEVLSQYINNKTKVLLKHEVCGHQWKILPVNFLKKDGNRCPDCSVKTSKAATAIASALVDHGVNFETEKTFEDCRLKMLLPFDFYLPEYNILVEYDGEMHDRPWQSKDRLRVVEKLKVTKLRDQTKTTFAKASSMTLVRIRYDENLEERLAYLFNLIDKGSTTSPKGRRLKRAEMGSTR